MDINDLSSVLVSFLYFLLVLALIFAVLLLVERWGKKHPDSEKTSGDVQDGDSEENGEKNEK